MRMPEVAALGQTAHAKIIIPVAAPEMSPTPADNRGRLPLGRHTPGMQDAVALVNHGRDFAAFDNRTLIRIAHQIKSHYDPAVNQFIKASYHGAAPVVH